MSTVLENGIQINFSNLWTESNINFFVSFINKIGELQDTELRESSLILIEHISQVAKPITALLLIGRLNKVAMVTKDNKGLYELSKRFAIRYLSNVPNFEWLDQADLEEQLNKKISELERFEVFDEDKLNRNSIQSLVKTFALFNQKRDQKNLTSLHLVLSCRNNAQCILYRIRSDSALAIIVSEIEGLFEKAIQIFKDQIAEEPKEPVASQVLQEFL
jgi:hypothetical protein